MGIRAQHQSSRGHRIATELLFAPLHKGVHVLNIAVGASILLVFGVFLATVCALKKTWLVALIGGITVSMISVPATIIAIGDYIRMEEIWLRQDVYSLVGLGSFIKEVILLILSISSVVAAIITRKKLYPAF